MFKCTDCSKIYDIKPDYCDCGNNIFEEIAETAPKQGISQKNNVSFGLKERFSRISFEQKLSVLIFVILLVFAVIPWLIPVKTAPQKAEKKPVPVKKEFPAIDELWTQSVEPEKPAQQPEPVQERVIEVIKQVYVPANTKTTAPQHSAPVQSQKTAQKTQPQPPKTVQKPKSTSKQAKSAKKTTKLTAQEQKELENYKGALRMALFNNLNVPSIQGAGECAVEFNIDSSGKLTNRNFTYQSDNKSLNDAVYYMLMRVPKFNPPPASYKGEKIKLKFKFNNGSIEVSFI